MLLATVVAVCWLLSGVGGDGGAVVLCCSLFDEGLTFTSTGLTSRSNSYREAGGVSILGGPVVYAPYL